MKVNDGCLLPDLVCERVFELSDDIRYVAVYYRGTLRSIARPISDAPGSWDSDKYEEIIVNPTLVTLLRQRGNIDCGGLRHVIVGYGNFTLLVHPLSDGHISVAFELNSGYARILPRIRKLLHENRLIIDN